MLVEIAVEVISRARCGENRADSAGSILRGNGNGSASGYCCLADRWIPCRTSVDSVKTKSLNFPFRE